MFYGKLNNVSSLVIFEADKFSEAEAAFHDAVDYYIAFCERSGKTPVKPVIEIQEESYE